MKITFEGKTIQDVFDQMQRVLLSAETLRNPDFKVTVASSKELPFPGDVPAAKTVAKAVDKPARTEKQLANDERLRERAQAKKAAGLKVGDKMTYDAALRADLDRDPVEKPVEAPPIDPIEVVKIRQKTITDLQEAYANGHQQEVFELLSRFGNGAKSFRELPPEAFLPISQAIAKGALT